MAVSELAFGFFDIMSRHVCLSRKIPGLLKSFIDGSTVIITIDSYYNIIESYEKLIRENRKNINETIQNTGKAILSSKSVMSKESQLQIQKLHKESFALSALKIVLNYFLLYSVIFSGASMGCSLRWKNY